MARPRRLPVPEPPPPRRRRGTGTIVVRGDRAYAQDVRDAQGHRESYEGRGLTLDQRKRDAESWLDGRLAARARAAGLLPETAGQYLARWLAETYRADADSGTYATRRSHLRWAAPIRDRLAGSVTAEDVDRLTDEMVAAGLANSYIRNVRQTLSMAFARLVPRVLDANPVGPYRRPLPLPKRRPKAWDGRPARDFLAVARRSRWGPLWTLASLYGLRNHELRGLEWADLNERSGELTIRDRKTHAERVIVLHRAVVDELAAYRDDPANASYTSATLMFVARPGCQMARSTLDEEFKRLVEQANAALVRDALADGLSPVAADRRRLPPLVVHGLRHTAATQMLRRGVPIAKVAEVLGHHSPAFTYQMYGWAVPSDAGLLDAAIGGLLDGVSPPESGSGQPNGSNPSE